MSQFDFEKTCREAAFILRLEDASALSSGKPVEVNGIGTAIFLHHDAQPCLACHFDIGPIPDGDRVAALEYLLMLNLAYASATSGVYGYEGHRNEAIFSVRLFHLYMMDGHALARALTAYTERARSAAALLARFAAPREKQDGPAAGFDPLSLTLKV